MNWRKKPYTLLIWMVHCLTGFGDNLNDIPLFRACDECYAVSNAVSELKEIATGVIEDNKSDAVAKFIYRREVK